MDRLNINLSMLIKNPGQIPPFQKAIVLIVAFLAVIFLGYWFDLANQSEALDTAQAQEVTLKNEFLSKKNQAVNLPLYKQQLHEIQVSFADLLRQLPNRSEMSALLNDINQAGIGRGLQFELFKPAPHETINEFYAELPVSIRVDGNYHDFGKFLEDVSRLSRIVNIDDLQISARPPTMLASGATSSALLVMDATAKTYRYLDPEEVEAQRKVARSKKGGAK